MHRNIIKARNRHKSFLFLSAKTRSGALERPPAISSRYSAIARELSMALKLFLRPANSAPYLQESVTNALFPIVTIILLHQTWRTKKSPRWWKSAAIMGAHEARLPESLLFMLYIARYITPKCLKFLEAHIGTYNRSRLGPEPKWMGLIMLYRPISR